VIRYAASAQGAPQGKGVADVTTGNHRPAPGRVPVVHSMRPARPVRPEPSWGRVLLTTVELWASRRLRQPAFLRRLVLAMVAIAAVTAAGLQLTRIFSASASAPRVVRPSVSERPAPPPSAVSLGPAAAAQSAAVAWITSQVSDTAVIGCYPAMCASLEAQGVSASRLVPLGSGRTSVLKTDVITTLPAAVGADSTLVDQYAPALIASFGAGRSRIEVRAVARTGAAAYQSALRSDLAARKSAAAQLLKNPRLKFTSADAARLRAGIVDSRLLATLAALSTQFTLRVMAFGDSAPGGPQFFREVTVASDGGRTGAATLAAALAMVNAQESPYQPAHSAIVQPGTGQAALTIEFDSPSPLGLLSMVLTADVQPDQR
jgi:hypothetical protein